MKELQVMIGDFLEDRPAMKANNNFENVVQLMLDEVEELKGAHINGDNKDIAQEVADVFIFAITLANILGVDIESEIREKVAYNHTRYTAADFSKGDYDQARETSRLWVQNTMWKEQFYSSNLK